MRGGCAPSSQATPLITPHPALSRGGECPSTGPGFEGGLRVDSRFRGNDKYNAEMTMGRLGKVEFLTGTYMPLK